MQLVIAEKPSVAASIAAALPLSPDLTLGKITLVETSCAGKRAYAYLPRRRTKSGRR